MNKKEIAVLSITLSLVLILLLMIVFAFNNYTKKASNANVENDKIKIATSSEEKNDKIEEDINIVNTNTRKTLEERYRIETIKLENGWKKYMNANCGIEFEFKDENDEYFVQTHGGFTTSGFNIEKKLQKGEKWNGYEVYGDIYYYEIPYKKELSLEDYLVKNGNWKYSDAMDKIISIEDKINKNDIKFIKITSDAYSVQRNNTNKKFIDSTYYIEYCQKKRQYHQGYFMLFSCAENNDKFCDDIINTFNYIDIENNKLKE